MWTAWRRDGQGGGRQGGLVSVSRRGYPSDLTDAQWALIEPLLPEPSTGGRPEKHPRREIVNAILYVVRSGCPWRYLPADLPPWQTVYWYFTACEDSAFFAFRSRAVPDFNRRDTAQHERLLAAAFADGSWRVPELLNRVKAVDDLPPPHRDATEAGVLPPFVHQLGKHRAAKVSEHRPAFTLWLGPQGPYRVPAWIFADLSPTEETQVLEEFMGIPVHPLLIHAAVVFVPLLAILTVAYALIPLVRPHIRWVLGLLALTAPISALLAKLSGDAFFARLRSRDRVTPEFLPKLESHRHFGTLTLYATIVLAILTLALVYFVGPRVAAARAADAAGSTPVVSLVLSALSLVAAAVSLYYVVRTGDSGAKAVWTGS